MAISESDINVLGGFISELSKDIVRYKDTRDEGHIDSMFAYSRALFQRLEKIIKSRPPKNTETRIISLSQWITDNRDKAYEPFELSGHFRHHDGKVIKFFSESNTEIVLITSPYNKPHWDIHVVIDEQEVRLPVHVLFPDGDFDNYSYKPESLFVILTRVKQFLGKPWMCRTVLVPVMDSQINTQIELIALSPVTNEEAINWAYEEDEILKKKELSAASAPIIKKYKDLAESNTRYEDTLISEEESEPTPHTRFTWGEGFNEWDTWTVKRKFNRKIFYKGLFVKEEIVETTSEENNK